MTVLTEPSGTGSEGEMDSDRESVRGSRCGRHTAPDRIRSRHADDREPRSSLSEPAIARFRIAFAEVGR